MIEPVVDEEPALSCDFELLLALSGMDPRAVLDNVLRQLDLLQPLLEIGLDFPAIVAEASRVPASFEVGQPLHFLLYSRPRTLTQVSGETVIRDAIFELSFDRSVNFGPALGLDAVPPRFQKFALGSRPELTLDEPFANVANTPAHVLTRHGESHRSPVPVERVPHSPQQDVSVPVLGVVMLDRHPLELC